MKNVETAKKNLLSKIKLLDRSGRTNALYEELFKRQTKYEFEEWVNKIKSGKLKISIVIPNGSDYDDLTMNSLKTVGKKLKVKFFESVTFTDLLGRKFRPNHKYNILLLPVCRLNQHLSSYIGVGKNNQKRNAMTDQVTGDSASGSMTLPETYIFSGLGLSTVLDEINSVRGGDRRAMLALDNALEQNGEASLEDLKNVRTKASSVKRLAAYFKGIHMRIDMD